MGSSSNSDKEGGENLEKVIGATALICQGHRERKSLSDSPEGKKTSSQARREGCTKKGFRGEKIPPFPEKKSALYSNCSSGKEPPEGKSASLPGRKEEEKNPQSLLCQMLRGKKSSLIRTEKNADSSRKKEEKVWQGNLDRIPACPHVRASERDNREFWKVMSSITRPSCREIPATMRERTQRKSDVPEGATAKLSDAGKKKSFAGATGRRGKEDHRSIFTKGRTEVGASVKSFELVDIGRGIF